MNRSLRFFMFLVVALLPLSIMAQIPNAGFENWSGGEPDGWFTSNFPPTIVNVTRSSDAHSGSFSARMEVKSIGPVFFPPWLISGNQAAPGFPCTVRYATLTGWYKLIPQQGDFILISAVLTNNNQEGIGFVSWATTVAAQNWTQFTAPIIYQSSKNPDSCFIQINLVDTVGASGGVALIDDLEFSGVNDIEVVMNNQLPTQFELKQNYPNPFNPSTTIEFSIPNTADVRLVVYNALGQEVETLINQTMLPGSYSAVWEAENLPNGVYLYQLSAGNFVSTKKLILMK